VSKTPPAPSTASVTCGESGSMVATTSASPVACATEAAAIPPAATSLSMFSAWWS